MKEFRSCIVRYGESISVFSGEAIYRLVPIELLRKWTRECPEYLLAYIHPRDLDAEQPMIEDFKLYPSFQIVLWLAWSGREIETMAYGF